MFFWCARGKIADALLSDAEAETDTYQYKAFGELNAPGGLTGGSTPNPFVFVGRQGYFRDSEIGLYLCSPGSSTHRYYDPLLGKWISPDREGFSAGDTNLSRYVGNDPINATDPSGAIPKGIDTIRLESPWEYSDLDEKEESAILEEWGPWNYVTFSVYITDYGTSFWKNALKEAGAFYQAVGIRIKWSVFELRSGRHRWTTELEGGGVLWEDPYQEYLQELDIWNKHFTDTDVKEGKEKEVQWYLENFPNVPSVFFIGSIDWDDWGFWELVLGTDAWGFAHEPFAWIAQSIFGPEYPKVVAHELGHVFGYPKHDPVGLMSEIPNIDAKHGQLKKTICRIRTSRLLHKAP